MDKYDKAIEYLTEYPEEILRAWRDPFGHVAGSLFHFLSPTGRSADGYGCPTTIKSVEGDWLERAITPEIEKEIRADDNIPDRVRDITVEMLPAFAKYQRMADAAGRVIKER